MDTVCSSRAHQGAGDSGGVMACSMAVSCGTSQLPCVGSWARCWIRVSSSSCTSDLELVGNGERQLVVLVMQAPRQGLGVHWVCLQLSMSC